MLSTTVNRSILIAATTVVIAACPSAALADFAFHKYVDKASPTIYETAGSSTSGATAPPAK